MMKRWPAVVLVLLMVLSLASSALALGDTVRWGLYSAPKAWFH